ncbi:MAG TPA: gas vesicle protein K [Planctomycetota bacterium]|nr:gas vesicle protein K [Planctomycetota bacterium]
MKKKTTTRRPRKTKVVALAADEIDALREELEKTTVPRWNADPEDVQRSVVRLVLALVEFLRKVMERQAIRRMEEKTLTKKEIEKVGTALMKLEETIHDLARRFHIPPEDLNLDLGPLGRLM